MLARLMIGSGGDFDETRKEELKMKMLASWTLYSDGPNETLPSSTKKKLKQLKLSAKHSSTKLVNLYILPTSQPLLLMRITMKQLGQEGSISAS